MDLRIKSTLTNAPGIYSIPFQRGGPPLQQAGPVSSNQEASQTLHDAHELLKLLPSAKNFIPVVSLPNNQETGSDSSQDEEAGSHKYCKFLMTGFPLTN